MKLLCTADDLWPLEEDDFQRDSVQLRLMSAASEMRGSSQVEEEFKRARFGAWKLIVQQAERRLLSTDNPTAIPFEKKDATCRARSIVENRPLLNQGQLVWQSINEGDSVLSEQIAKQLERKTKSPANRIALLTGQLWVDPDYPLWLMRADPAWRVVEAFNSEFADTPEVTEENFNRIKQSSLKSYPQAPIVGLSQFRDLKKTDSMDRFTGYELSRSFQSVARTLPVPPLPGFDLPSEKSNI
ncbi:MAG: hypothetical protein ACI8UO_004135 [Verrucomicrobiales bacterium]